MVFLGAMVQKLALFALEPAEQSVRVCMPGRAESNLRAFMAGCRWAVNSGALPAAPQ
jgi:hypothetical protein